MTDIIIISLGGASLLIGVAAFVRTSRPPRRASVAAEQHVSSLPPRDFVKSYNRLSREWKKHCPGTRESRRLRQQLDIYHLEGTQRYLNSIK